MNEDQLRADIVKALCVDHGHSRQSGSEHCRVCNRRADAVLGVVAPLLADRDGQLTDLKWLHAEAVWLREQAVMEEALRWRKIVEQWERGHQNDVLPYTSQLETEVERLRRGAQFEANGGDAP